MCPIVVLLVLIYLLSEMLTGFSSAYLTSFLFFFLKWSLYPYLLSVSLWVVGVLRLVLSILHHLWSCFRYWRVLSLGIDFRVNGVFSQCRHGVLLSSDSSVPDKSLVFWTFILMSLLFISPLVTQLFLLLFLSTCPPTGVSLIEPNAGNPKMSLYERGYKEIPAT